MKKSHEQMRNKSNPLINRRSFQVLIILILVILLPISVLAVRYEQSLSQNVSSSKFVRIEGEKAALSGPVHVISDTTASGGKAIQFVNNVSSSTSPVVSSSPTPPTGGIASMPSGLISRNQPAFTSDSQVTASDANDNTYDTTTRLHPPAWLAYDLSSVPVQKRGKVLIAWFNDSNYDYYRDPKNGAYNLPGNYTIDVNAAAGGGKAPTSGWVTKVTVTMNGFRSRQHVVDMAGYNWIRMNVTTSTGSVENTDADFNLDVYDANQGIPNDIAMMGDSITAGDLGHSSVNDTGNVSQLINAAKAQYFPLIDDAGMSFWTAGDGMQVIDQWLPNFPGKFVALNFGTNDQCSTDYKQNMIYMINAIIAAGKIPIIPHIPASPQLASCGPTVNATIDQLYAQFPQIIHGPDLWAVFLHHPELFADGLHPNSQGIVVYRKAWANTLLAKIYNGTTAIDKTAFMAQASTINTHKVPNATMVLPGQQIWNNGVSSYIFGTNDTGEWGTPNIEFQDSLTAPGTPNTVVQNLVKQGGFSLMRKFIGHHDGKNGTETTDAALQAIGNTMTNSGTQCLINLPNVNTTNVSRKSGDHYSDLQFAQHVLSMFDGNHPGYIKCSMFEIGNEPDISGLPVDAYLHVWNTYVTTLKQTRSDALFIGPVLAGYNPGYMQDFLQGIVTNHYPVPNAIDWHYYPCGWASDVNWPHCFNVSIPEENPITQASDIRNKMQSILGYQLPIGISEWSADSGAHLENTEPQMSQFITLTLNQMVQAKLDFANEFDMQSFAGYGVLDMIDKNNQPKPYFYAFTNATKQYRTASSGENITPATTQVPCTITLPSDTGVAVISNVVLPSSGSYNIFTRMKVRASGNSFYLQIDNTCPKKITDTTGVNTWDWITSPVRLSYILGTGHKITLYGKDQYVEIDELLFSQSCTPKGTGNNC